MYNEFADVYDSLIDTDYEKFVSYYKEIFTSFNIKPHLVADLGCGTGTLCALMQKEGFDMIGIDASPEMLSVAKRKYNDILFLNQSVCDFELYGTVDAAISSLDVINYLTEKEDVLKLFLLIKNYLNPGGIYIFDTSSYYKLSEILGNNTFVFEEGDIFYTWENSFQDDILEMYLTFFKKEGNLYKKFEEEQIQRAYKSDEICALAEKAGLNVVGVFGDFSFEGEKENSERIFYVLKKGEI